MHAGGQGAAALEVAMASALSTCAHPRASRSAAAGVHPAGLLGAGDLQHRGLLPLFSHLTVKRLKPVIAQTVPGAVFGTLLHVVAQSHRWGSRSHTYMATLT